MQISGELITVGDMASDDVQLIVGVPAVQIRTSDGRIVTVTGLTRDEARSAAEHFGSAVALNLAAA